MQWKLSRWCKDAQIAMVNKDIDMNDLAEAMNWTRQYTSSLINGRVYSYEAVLRLSYYLGITPSDGDTRRTGKCANS